MFVCYCVYCGLLHRVMLSRQARLHMACGALTYNSPSCLSAVVWPTFIKTNTAICFVLHFHENGINKWQGGGQLEQLLFFSFVLGGGIHNWVEQLLNTPNK